MGWSNSSEVKRAGCSSQDLSSVPIILRCLTTLCNSSHMGSYVLSWLPQTLQSHVVCSGKLPHRQNKSKKVFEKTINHSYNW